MDILLMLMITIGRLLYDAYLKRKADKYAREQEALHRERFGDKTIWERTARKPKTWDELTNWDYHGDGGEKK